MPERIECIDDRSLLIADHPHLDRRQIFRDIADILVLGAARQDFAADHQRAAVTTSLEAGEVAVGMITCERSRRRLLEFDRLRLGRFFRARYLSKPMEGGQSRSLPEPREIEENFKPPSDRGQDRRARISSRVARTEG
jgi:hypothetical protein